MNSYFDIKINTDKNTSENILISRVYTELHKALWSLKSNDIGIDFPKSDEYGLGGIIRVYGIVDKLRILNSMIGGLIECCSISNIKPVPDKCQFKTVSRLQSRTCKGLNSKFKRFKKRNPQLTEKEIREYRRNLFLKGKSKKPFVILKSASNGENYPIFINFSEQKDEVLDGEFNSFGLSKISTVPWF